MVPDRTGLKSMKAFLLAAGYGTRLKPLTDTIPKCMVPIHGQPMLGWWFDLFRSHGVTEVLVNTHYLPETVRGYLKAYNDRNTGLRAYETYEPVLLGSGGTVRGNRDFVRGEKDFLICYADNLTDADLTAFRLCHERHQAPLTMALFHTNQPSQCGIASLDVQGRIVRFEEKPANPKSDLANAGLYIANQQIFDFMDPQKETLDFGKDVLPKLVGEMVGWPVEGYLIDMGTPENLSRANGEWHYDYHEDTASDQLYGRRN